MRPVSPRLRRLLPSAGIAGPLWSLFGRYRWSVPVVVLGGVVSSGLEGVSIGLLVPLLTALVPGEPTGLPGPLARVTDLTARFGDHERLLLVGGAIFVSVLVKAGVQALNATFRAWVDAGIGHDIRSALARRLLTVEYPFFLDHDPSRLITVISTDSWRVSDAVRMVFSLLIAVAALGVFGAFMLLISWELLAVVALGIAFIRLVQATVVHRLHGLGEKFTAANTVLAGRMMVVVEAIRLIRIFGQEERERHRFARASDDVRGLVFDLERTAALASPVVEVLQAALFICVLLSAHALGMQLPVIAAFLVLLYRSEPHLRSASQARLGLAGLRQSIREVEWLLGPRPAVAGAAAPAPRGPLAFEGGSLTPPDRPGMKPLGPRPAAAGAAAPAPPEAPRGPLAFEGVSFSYPNRPEAEPVLQDVSFVLHEGRTTALIGRSGSGKSTVINLICRFLEPTAGTIRVGGADLAGIDTRLWRRDIGLAGQDIDLIEGTVADNIAYGMPEASPDAIERAARGCDAHEFIRRLPDGYATRVGARGLSLSGGQRQRIGIARAVIRRPRVLILDEATNAVDAMSEEAVMTVLRDQVRAAITILVSHRPSTLARCDDGVVIERGRVAEAGPMSSLRATRSLARADRSTPAD